MHRITPKGTCMIMETILACGSRHFSSLSRQMLVTVSMFGHCKPKRSLNFTFKSVSYNIARLTDVAEGGDAQDQIQGTCKERDVKDVCRKLTSSAVHRLITV